MSSALVSIVMPVKNAAPFLVECLESILAQTHTNWELLAVNDHSTDDTPTLLYEFSKRDERIHWLTNKGNGIIPALQTAYKASSGEFITRMDADDIMTPNKLSVMTAQLHKAGVGYLATGGVHYFSEGRLGKGFERYASWLNKLTIKAENFKEMYKECVIPSPCWMVYRSDFESCGAFNAEVYPEDYDLAFRFYKHGLQVIPSDEVLHHWRDYASRTSRTDENYADNSFIPLKCHYFLELDYKTDRTLILWGAGQRGKKVAQCLIENKVNFRWICNNQRKIGKFIYGVEMESFKQLKRLENKQFILTMANHSEQKSIKRLFSSYKLIMGEDYFFWV